jgi:uncharacterized protein (DUF2267 family)
LKVFDYYSGFEGEPEITIIQRSKKGHNVAILKLWIAYFNTIIELIDPNDKGHFEGVTLHYQLVTGWHDEPWECDDIELFLKQLESIEENKLNESPPESIERVSLDVLRKLKSILENAIHSKDKIVIEYN